MSSLTLISKIYASSGPRKQFKQKKGLISYCSKNISSALVTLCWSSISIRVNPKFWLKNLFSIYLKPVVWSLSLRTYFQIKIGIQLARGGVNSQHLPLSMPWSYRYDFWKTLPLLKPTREVVDKNPLEKHWPPRCACNHLYFWVFRSYLYSNSMLNTPSLSSFHCKRCVDYHLFNSRRVSSASRTP